MKFIQPINFKVFFVLFFKGAKPSLQQIGPYYFELVEICSLKMLLNEKKD